MPIPPIRPARAISRVFTPLNTRTAAAVIAGLLLFTMPRVLHGQDYRPCVTACDAVGYLSKNPYLPGSTSSPFSRYDPDSPSNPYGRYGSRYSPDGARNPYATGGLSIYGADGTYLGKLNANRYDPESVSNPYGRYGSRYSSTSVNNPYSRFGSKYSPYSAENPYASTPPKLKRPCANKDSAC